PKAEVAHDGDRALSRSAITPTRTILVLLMLIIGIVYGLHFSANRWAVEAGVPIFAYVFWYCLGAGLVLLSLSAVFRELPKLRWNHLWVYLVMGCFGIAAPLALLTWLSPKLPTGVIGLIVVIAPIITYLFAMVLRLDRFRWVSIGGIVAGLAAVLLVTVPDTSLPEPGMAGWLLLALLAPISFAATNIFAATIRPPAVSSLTLSTGILLGAAALMLPLMFVTGQAWAPPAATAQGNIALLTAIGINVVIWWIFLEIVRNAGPIFFSQSNYLVVLAGLGWGILLFGEEPSPFIWGATALIFIGVGLIAKGQKSGLDGPSGT
ncbi:MAG: DMT family transporter, partial [Rhodospirillales bacterium]